MGTVIYTRLCVQFVNLCLNDVFQFLKNWAQKVH